MPRKPKRTRSKPNHGRQRLEQSARLYEQKSTPNNRRQFEQVLYQTVSALEKMPPSTVNEDNSWLETFLKIAPVLIQVAPVAVEFLEGLL
jgi:hypothetical protein